MADAVPEITTWPQLIAWILVTVVTTGAWLAGAKTKSASGNGGNGNGGLAYRFEQTERRLLALESQMGDVRDSVARLEGMLTSGSGSSSGSGGGGRWPRHRRGFPPDGDSDG